MTEARDLPAPGHEPASLPLTGIKVVTVEHAVAAPLCSRHLADLGAEVVKVESPVGGDLVRHYDSVVKGQSAYFVWANRGKCSVVLDLKADHGKKLFRRLLGTADVFVHNLGPGAMDRLGFDRASLRDHSFVDRARQAGASVVCGGHRPGDEALDGGFFYQPTIVSSVTNDMEIARDEIFGPVLSVIPFDEDEAIRIANDTSFGLGTGVWTTDIKRGHRGAHAIRAGNLWVNCYRMLTYNIPFGGYKMSGLGRENGIDAVREYTETKAVWIDLSTESRDPFVMG